MAEEDDTPSPPPKKKHKLGRTKRGLKYARELKAMNIHKPYTTASAKDVRIMKDLQGMLRETWHSLWDKADNFKRLSEKQIGFARAYALNGRRFVARSMREGGYTSKDDDDLYKMGNKYLKDEHFLALVKAFEIEEKARMKINVEDVVKWFNDIATAAMESADYTNANRAMENLAKYLGMFVERKEITHKTIHSREELDARIAELTAVLRDSEAEIERNLRIN